MPFRQGRPGQTPLGKNDANWYMMWPHGTVWLDASSVVEGCVGLVTVAIRPL
ncbi:hypothetical protein KBZ00_27235 [Streptomyces sp. RK31]|uniref:hypothetical protein n=1 Tax=Streptomyces sp. RK31 TaxID=2824892 RepID=UPI001B35D319|nr:hypothetical protein [Streptomyces sp. RK31]MBQ0974794.1 hypothetical protein [Streptomyces sp. RK31]